MGCDNLQLLSQYKNGDESALDLLISENMGLVRSVALRFKDRGTDYEDLIQIGSIGLLRAARSFDFSYDCMFSTYAVPLIIGEIRRYLRDDGLIKVSRKLKSTGVQVLRQKEEFSRIYGRDPSISELSKISGMPPEEIISALDASGPIRSFSEAIGAEDDATLADFISDDDTDAEKVIEKIALSEALDKLTDQQKELISLRYFKNLSQEKTGEILGMTQVKVSREEKKIMGILRKML